MRNASFGTQPRQKGLARVLEGQVDVPMATLNGLILNASGHPDKLAKDWMAQAKRDAESLCHERDTNTLEIEDLINPEVELTTSDVINPVSTVTAGQSVGYIPLTFPHAEDLTFWGLVDTGAQVSVITAGLANYLNLIDHDFSNISSTPFSVSGYNGNKSYMPTLTTYLKLGRYGGPERKLAV